jgi:hypothetical protein
MVLAAAIEAIGVVMSDLDTRRRKHALTMDKWMSIVFGEQQLALSLVFNTSKLSVAMTKKYLAETLNILQTVWLFGGMKQFKAMIASYIVGKLVRL